MENVTLVKNVVNFRVIPGAIEDNSFISPRAKEFCDVGYQNDIGTSIGMHIHHFVIT